MPTTTVLPYDLGAAVGRLCPNRPSDVAQIRELVNRQPIEVLSPLREVPERDLGALADAIAHVQGRHLSELGLGAPDGMVGRGSELLSLLYRKAAPIPYTVPASQRIPDSARWMQADRRWWLVNLNTTTSLDYTFWYRGCAVATVATAFRARDIRLPDAKQVAVVAARKHAAAKAHEADPKVKAKGGVLLPHGMTDFAEITPLTLDAWMTGSGSRGYASTQSASIDWVGVTAVSSRVQFDARIERKDAKFPSPAMLRAWLEQGKCVIGNVKGGDHFVVVAGYRGESEFVTFDVGYSTEGKDPNLVPEGYTVYQFRDLVKLITYAVRPP